MWLAQGGERQNCEDIREEDIEADVMLNLRQSYAELEADVMRSLSQSYTLNIPDDVFGCFETLY